MSVTPSRRLSRRALVAGVGVAVAYAAVYVGTLRLVGGHQRPLFDGFAPSAPYRWVDPPPEFEAGNVKPRPSTTDLPIGPDGFKATGATTEDGQLVLNLPDGAVPPRPGDSQLRVVVRALAPAKLGALPRGLYPSGNAYRIELSYRPSGQVIDAMAQPGTIFMTVPVPAVAIAYSPDGRAWQRLDTTTGEGPSTSPVAPFSRAGHYLGVAHNPTAVPDQGGSGDTPTVVLVAVLTAVLVVALVVGPVLVRRARRRRAKAKGGRRPRSGAPKPGKAGGAKPRREQPRRSGSSGPKSGRPRSKRKKRR